VRFDVTAGEINEVDGLISFDPSWTIDGSGVASYSEMFE
jgi:hypothetical protein